MKIEMCVRKSSLLLLSLLSFSVAAVGQSYYQPYSYQFYQKMNSVLYGQDTRQHTAIKPLIIDSVLQPTFDSLMNVGQRERTSWLGRKLFNEHLIQIEKEDYSFYADFLPDFQIGKVFKEGTSSWLNTRGFQLGGTIGKKFTFYTNGFENQARFPNYVNDYIFENMVVPGQQGKLYDHRSGEDQDWSYVSANISYTANKYLNISLAYDKNFIGDGYRSMLLSDFSSNYTALKLTGTLGNVRYLTMFTYMLDPYASRAMYPESETGERNDYGDMHKWGAIQYLDWNVNNRLSLGFFQSVIWASYSEMGNRGFDFNYIHPLAFLRPIESANTASPDKMHLGLNAKYKLLHSLSLYGQLLLSEFNGKEFFAGNGFAHNKYAYQLGFRGFDLFGVKNLSYLAEYNAARPYTYQHYKPITAYTNYNEPLAHPYGANFKEGLAMLNYSLGRFDFQFQGTVAIRGLDPSDDLNYGGNIFKSYETYVNLYGNYIGQGLKTDFSYFDLRASYLINPKYNLRLEISGTSRNERNEQWKNNSNFISFGLRSSFRNLYYDF